VSRRSLPAGMRITRSGRRSVLAGAGRCRRVLAGRRPRVVLGALVASSACCALLALPAPAPAIYGPVGGGAEIVSVDHASDEQADAPSTDVDISANGRYVVFQTRATNFFEDDGVPGGDPEPPGACREGGIFRYDRDTGELTLVADGTEVAVNAQGECEPSRVLVRGAENPSISANGQYVVFSSAQQLVPGTDEHNENVEVYRRDMNVPLTPDRAASGAYVLVSAQNGSEAAPVYDNSSISPLAGGDPGSEAWPDTAISANGEYVLFRSSELSSSLPEGSTATTPPHQLFVRDIGAKTTTLVTRKKKGEADEGGPAGGAEGPAALSADGSTVAWLGEQAPTQTVFLPGEEPHEGTRYYLWRRWQEPAAVTRRITGIADPEDPECPPGESVELNPTIEGPCYGPLTYQEDSVANIDTPPALSTDGYTVAFLTGSALRPDFLKPDSLDLFLTSMRPGVTRKAGTRALTLATSGAQGDGDSAISSLALSADGTHIAFVSQRNAFALPELALTGSFSETPLYNELYVIDLPANTLERAIVGLEDGEPNGSTLGAPALSENGSTLAFVSEASNLIFGDANKVADAFTATFQPPAGTATLSAGASSAQGGFSLSAAASPELGVSVRRAKNGGITLLVETPGPGKIVADARGTIPKAKPAKTAVKARKAAARAAKAASKPKVKAKKKAAAPVLFASATATAPAEGTTTLTLRLSAKYVADLRRERKLDADVTIVFTPPGPAETLTDEVSAAFVATSPAKQSSKRGGKGKAKQ
jgi:WD40-like Beta Propeller Repeat